MKKYLLLITLILTAHYSNSQDLKAVRIFVDLRQYDKAKTELDNYMGNAANAAKAEGWYYKAYIYNSLGRVETKPVAESKSLYNSAFDAIKKYAELDPKAPMTVEEKNSTVFNIYYGFFDLGVKTYNEKNFTETYDLFKKALEIHDYIYDKKIYGPNDLKFPAHDTDLVYNLSFLANDLKKMDEAMVYYKKIADADLADEKYAGAYDALILKYKRENNAELFTKYIAAAKKHYPVDKTYWELKEIDFATNGLEGEALLKKYEELTISFPDNYYVFYNYGAELDKFINSPEANGKDISASKIKLEEVFKKSISINSTIEANLQLANFYYSSSLEIQEQAARIKGTKPVELKLKNELLTKSKETMNKCIPYAEEAIKLSGALKEYKNSEKANYKLAYDFLITAAKQNNNAAKAAEYEKKKEEVDKL